MDLDAHNLSQAARYLLSAQFVLGAQQRLVPTLFSSSTSRIPISHAQAFRSTLPFIPSSSSTQHTRAIGLILLTGGSLLLIPRSKSTPRHGLISTLAKIGEGLAVGISTAFLYTHWKFGFDVLLPSFNLILAGVMLWGRGRPEYGVRRDDIS